MRRMHLFLAPREALGLDLRRSLASVHVTMGGIVARWVQLRKQLVARVLERCVRVVETARWVCRGVIRRMHAECRGGDRVEALFAVRLALDAGGLLGASMERVLLLRVFQHYFN